VEQWKVVRRLLRLRGAWMSFGGGVLRERLNGNSRFRDDATTDRGRNDRTGKDRGTQGERVGMDWRSVLQSETAAVSALAESVAHMTE
jgi:hypothetical protein